MTRYRGRFAPSPTGPLHFGSLVTAMASYADALGGDGEWMVRIEDIDAPRARQGAADAILSMLERLGFEWQGPVWRQSERTERYAEALERLRACNLAYPCACTRGERAHDAVGRIGERIYPGTCRGGIDADRAKRSRQAIRVRVPADASFRDRRVVAAARHGLRRGVARERVQGGPAEVDRDLASARVALVAPGPGGDLKWIRR